MATTRLTFYLIPSIHRLLVTEKFSPAIPFFMPLDGSLLRVTECEHRDVIKVKQFWRFLHVKDDWFIAHERLVHWVNHFVDVAKFPDIQFERTTSVVGDDQPIRISACGTIPEISCTYGQLRRYISHGARSRSGKIIKIDPIRTPNGMAVTINLFRKFIEDLQS